MGLNASTAAQTKSATLRTLSQPWEYSKLVQLSQKKAKAILVEHGCLPRNLRGICCWECGGPLAAASSSSSGGGKSEDILQCAECLLPGRHRRQLRHARLAWPPFWTSQTKKLSGAALSAVPVFLLLDRLQSSPGLDRPSSLREGQMLNTLDFNP